jgi:hypothetical protein
VDHNAVQPALHRCPVCHDIYVPGIGAWGASLGSLTCHDVKGSVAGWGCHERASAPPEYGELRPGV